MADATYELIAAASVTVDGGTFDFQNIPQTFTDLQLVIYTRDTFASPSFGGYGDFNADTTAGNYPYNRMFSDGSAQAQRDASLTGFAVGELPAANATANNYGVCIMDIQNYTNTDTYKPWAARTGCVVSTAYVFHYVGFWKSTAAITRIRFQQSGGGLKAGSRANLYGIKAG